MSTNESLCSMTDIVEFKSSKHFQDTFLTNGGRPRYKMKERTFNDTKDILFSKHVGCSATCDSRVCTCLTPVIKLHLAKFHTQWKQL